MKPEFIQDLTLRCLGQLRLIKNKQASATPIAVCRTTTTQLSYTPLIVAPEIGQNISTIHTTDRDWHLYHSATREVINF